MNNFIKYLWLFLCFMLVCDYALAQPDGPNNPSTAGTDATVGTITWSNTGNVFSSDNSRATTDLDNNGDVSYYLTATNFGFAIPSGSTIDGIVVEIERSDNGGAGNIKDNLVKIIKGGVITGTDQSAGGNWPSSDAYKTYGSSVNLWGTAWTVADINSSNFGVVISAKRTGGGGNNKARIDHIRITVYYTASLPIGLLSFNGQRDEECNTINWITVAEFNNDYFTIEKSSDGINFNILEIVKGAGNSTSILSYSAKDTHPFIGETYYRLSQTDFNGTSQTFEIIGVYNENSTHLTVVRITNLSGQDIPDTYNGVKIYYFSDGSVIKKLQLK